MHIAGIFVLYVYQKVNTEVLFLTNCSTTVVQFTRLLEQQMILTTLHGVRRQVPVKLQPPRYQRPAVKVSQKTTIKAHHPTVMPL